jgi:hypothetical protein
MVSELLPGREKPFLTSFTQWAYRCQSISYSRGKLSIGSADIPCSHHRPLARPTSAAACTAFPIPDAGCFSLGMVRKAARADGAVLVSL